MSENYVISVVLSDTGGWVELPEKTVNLIPATAASMTKQAVGVLVEHVREIARPRDVKVHEGDVIQHLRVTPDGSVSVTSTEQAAVSANTLTPPGGPTTRTGRLPVPPSPVVPPDEPAGSQPAREVSPSRATPTQAKATTLPKALPPIAPPREGLTRIHESPSSTPAATPTRAPGDSITHRERRSFIAPTQTEGPARHGVRGMLSRAGLHIQPSAAELAERDDKRAVAQHWPGKRTIAIVNGKGGAGKTPATVCLAAVFAHYGGAGVTAWDNNQNRGTLGWRTEQGPHDATLLDLLPNTKDLLGPQAEAADIAKYVHHQTEDKYDVLRSQPMMLRDEQRLGVRDFNSIHKVLGKYYRLILVDSGNDESDPLWGRMIDHADQIVVATSTRGDIAEAGALLLEGLATRDEHAAALARGAVVVVSQANQHAPAREAADLAHEFSHIAREAVTIPYDRGMVEGHLRMSTLKPATRRAWLSAGAAVARGL